MKPPKIVSALNARLTPAWRLAVHFLLWSLVVGSQWCAWPTSVSDVKLVTNGVPQPITLPYKTQHGVSERNDYTFDATFHSSLLTRGHLHMASDDCVMGISIGGVNVHSSGCRPCETCTMTPFALPSLPSGDLPMRVTVRDYGGTGTLAIREYAGITGRELAVVALGGWLLLALFSWRRRSMLHAWVAAGSVVVALNYNMVTDSDTRQHDVGGHKEYVEHVGRHGTLPTVKQGWETWQPPTYYVLTAVYVKATNFLGSSEHARSQHLGALLFVLAVAILAWFWEALGFSRRTGWLGLVLMLIMPAHVFTSARISNDTFMPLLGVAALLLSSSYERHGRKGTAAAMGLLCMLALSIKSSSLSLAAGCGLMLLWKDHRDGRTLLERAGRALLLGVPPTLWLAFWFWRNHEQTGEWVYVNGNVQDALRIPNTAFKFLWFDVPVFLSEPWFSTFGGKLRDSFPTSLAVSSLTGEFDLSWVPTVVQTFLRAALLPVLVVFLWGAINRPAGWRVRPWLPALLLFGWHAFFMSSYNWQYPFACNQDARLWGLAYAPAAVLVTWGWESSLERLGPRLARVAAVVPLVFLVALLVFWKRFFWG